MAWEDAEPQAGRLRKVTRAPPGSSVILCQCPSNLAVKPNALNASTGESESSEYEKATHTTIITLPGC